MRWKLQQQGPDEPAYILSEDNRLIAKFDLNGNVLWVEPPYQAAAETVQERLQEAIVLAQTGTEEYRCSLCGNVFEYVTCDTQEPMCNGGHTLAESMQHEAAHE